MITAFQWDLGRQVERLDWLISQLPRYADWGYRELYLHLEDAVEFPSLPGVARKDAYSQRQFARLVGEAARVGIGVVPIVNLLGHTQYLIKVPALRDLNELRAPDGSPMEIGQVCPLHPRMLEVADALGELRGKPAGTVRITATEHAVRTVLWPRLQPWLPQYPDIKVEISSDNRFIDIVADRYRRVVDLLPDNSVVLLGNVDVSQVGSTAP